MGAKELISTLSANVRSVTTEIDPLSMEVRRVELVFGDYDMVTMSNEERQRWQSALSELSRHGLSMMQWRDDLRLATVIVIYRDPTSVKAENQ